MRDVRDMSGESVTEARGVRGARKPLVTLVSHVSLVVVLIFAAGSVFAQGPASRSTRENLGRGNGPLPQFRNRSLQRGNAAAAQSAAQQSAAQPAADPNADPSALNWDAAPVDIVLQAYGDRVKKTILKDPACPSATITLKSRPGQKLTDEEYIEAIETILEMNGVHLEPYGESFIRALPRKDVRKEGIPLIMDPEERIGETSRTVSMMINFKHIATDEAQKMLEGLKSNSGILLVFERTNSILVTDSEQNINRMLEIAKMVDVATPVTENVFVRQIEHASAQEIQEAIQKIVEESQKEQEKGGKQTPQAAQHQPQIPPRPSLLRRPGQQQQQQQTPVNNESLVMSVSDADRGMIRGKVVIVPDERSNKLIFVTSKSNMDFFDKVIEQLDVETTPDTVVKVYRLKYAEAEDVSDMINDLIGNSSSSKESGKGNQNQNAKQGSGGNLTRNTPAGAAKKPANQRTGDAKAGELNKENTTVLADKRINGLVVMTRKELVPVIESIIESMDIKLSQVLIETVIIEVGLGNGIETGIDWVQRGRGSRKQETDSNGSPLYWAVDPNTGAKNGLKTTETSWTDSSEKEHLLDPVMGLVRDNFVNRGNYMLGGGAGSADGSKMLNQVVSEGWGTANPIGGGINYFLKSDKLNLAAVIKASQTDSRTKYVASPVIMTVDNKEAIINATKMRYLLKGFTSSGNSYSTIAVPDYEQKELGIEIKVTPKINPNGTVMLTVNEKYSQVSGSQDIKYATGNSRTTSTAEQVADAVTGAKESSALETVTVDTTATREMSADVVLEDGQTVVFGGLTETFKQEKESGIPILKDIPWIGRWLFGSVSIDESRSELLVFMTPYVLEGAEAAQAEALRRKKTLSDPRPWEDHGWSASKLADPVSHKEQLRRLKDEWAKQDEERRTKIAIEKEKVERVKKLESLSKEERDLWLKMHKEELDEEKQEELEKKMLDDESQEELKKLAAEIRKEKLKKADEAEAAAAVEADQPNEREKLDAEKAEAEEKK